MNLDFTEDQEMLRTMARDFLQKECPKTLVRELEESELGYSPEIWQKMAELGWLGLVFPEEYSGAGLGFVDLAILLEEMGRNILPGPFFSTVVLGGLPILEAGTEEQKRNFLPKIAMGEMLLAFALTEPNANYEPSAISLRAAAEGEDYILNGTKLFVADAHIAHYFLVVARTRDSASPEEGITIFLADAKSPGISFDIMPTMGMDKQCEVVFNNVKVSRGSILGDVDQGWEIVKKTLMQARAAKCAEITGGAQAAFDMSLSYANERVQYKKTIGSSQVIQHYLANMWMDVDTTRDITYEAAWRVGEGLPDAGKQVIAAKAWAGEAYKRVTERGVQIHGAIGTTRDHDMGLYYRRAKVAELAFGGTDYMRELMARELEI